MTFNKKEYSKEWKAANPEKVREHQRKWRAVNPEYDKEYYLKNKEHKKEYDKEYNLKNKEQRSKKYKEYYLKNIEHFKEYRLKTKEYRKKWFLKNKQHTRDYARNKYKTDINFKLRINCRNRIRMALKGNFKSASTMKLIGCTIDELRSHLESLFEPWMTWENHGLWDIEHKKAMSNFDFRYPAQQHACCHWSNLQPMEHVANMKKGNK